MALDGKVAIVTGSSSGIGAETAVCFAARGAKVVITGRNQEGLDETAKRCLAAGATSANIFVVTGDLTDKSVIAKIIDGAVTKFSKIDILVNNAGQSFYGGLTATSDADISDVFSINTVAVFNMTKEVIPWLLKTRGCVVNVSSLYGNRAVPTMLAYAMSKAAVDQFTKCTAIEYASKGVRINAVCPGHTKTPMWPGSGSNEGTEEAVNKICLEMSRNYPMQRVGQPSEVAAAILFLASDQSSYTTGALLPVCGGRECCIQGALVN